MFKIKEMKALPQYRLWLLYEDGAQGEVDLSSLVGKGVFKAWEDAHFFNRAQIGEEGQVCWSDEIEFCPDALYLKITRKTVEEIFPSISNELAHA